MRHFLSTTIALSLILFSGLSWAEPGGANREAAERQQTAQNNGATQIGPGYNKMAAPTPVMKGGAPVPGWGRTNEGSSNHTDAAAESHEGPRGNKDTNGNVGSRGNRGE